MTNSVIEALYRLNTRNQAYVAAQLRALDLTIHQARSLQFIAQHPQTNQKALAHYLGKHDATVTNLLKVLEKRQLLTRMLTPGDERQKQLTLTAAGQAAVASAQAIFAHREQQIAELLSAMGHEQLVHTLQNLAGQLDQ